MVASCLGASVPSWMEVALLRNALRLLVVRRSLFPVLPVVSVWPGWLGSSGAQGPGPPEAGSGKVATQLTQRGAPEPHPRLWAALLPWSGTLGRQHHPEPSLPCLSHHREGFAPLKE